MNWKTIIVSEDESDSWSLDSEAEGTLDDPIPPPMTEKGSCESRGSGEYSLGEGA